jgi:hypothetical protein
MVGQHGVAPTAIPTAARKTAKDSVGPFAAVAVVPGPVMGLPADTCRAWAVILYPEAVRVGSRHGETYALRVETRLILARLYGFKELKYNV